MRKLFLMLAVSGAFFVSNAAMAGDIVSTTAINTNLSWRITEQGELIVEGSGGIPTYTKTGDGSNAPWHAYQSQIKKVTISENITSIGNYAFRGLTQSESVSLPSTLTSIGQTAFENNTNLKSATIPNMVSSMGKYAFKDATNLTSLTIGSGLTTIPEEAFYGASSLVNLTINEGITNIDKHAFENATSLKTLKLPDSLHSIGEGVFSRATSLTSIDFGGVTEIGNKSFAYNFALTSLTIPDTVQTIGDGTFVNATGLKELVLGDGLTSLGKSSFSLDDTYNTSGTPYASQLEKITIGKNLVSIGSGCFTGAPIKEVTIDALGSAANYDAILGLLKNWSADIKVNCLGGDTCSAKMEDAINRSSACKNPTSSTCTNLKNKLAGMLANGEVNVSKTPAVDQSETQTGGMGGGSTEASDNIIVRRDRRIYTVAEATRVARKGGNTVKIRYR